MRHVFTVAIVAAMILSSIAVFPVAQAQSDEWPADRESAPEVSPGTYTGEINSTDDVDALKVPVKQGDTVTLTLDKEIRKDTVLQVNWPGSGLSYPIDIRDESGSTITRKVTAEENGHVYVEIVSTTAETSPEQWELKIERTRGADEWRDDRNSAEEVSPGTYSGEVNSPDDTDGLKVPVRQGDTVTLTLDKEIRKDTVLNINWAGSGLSYPIDFRNESGSTITRKVTAEENGYVYVEIVSNSVETSPEQWELKIERTRGADEWRDDRNSAEEVSPGTHTGNINSPDDTDALKVPVRQGDTVTLTLNKEIEKDTVLNVNWPGSGLSYPIDIRDESGSTITRKVTAEENGYVYVEIVSNSVETSPEQWELKIERTRGADEWRDRRSIATEISIGESVSGNVNSPDDTDALKVPVRQGDTVTLTLNKEIEKDTVLNVNWPGSGLSYPIDFRNESGSTITHKVTAEENGYVYVEIVSNSVETSPELWSLGINTDPSSGETNAPPEVTLSTSASTVQPSQQVTLSASASDPDGDTLAYDWTQTAGPSVTLTDSSTATPEFTAPDISESSTLTFEVEVSDGNGNSVTETVSITVDPKSTSNLPDGIARFDQGDDGKIGNLDVLQAVNAANNNEEIGGEPVSNLDILQLVNRATS